VGARDGLTAIDATARGFDALWRLRDVKGRIESLARSPKHCSVISFEEGVLDAWGRAGEPWRRWERWTFDLPGIVLRRRVDVSPPGGDVERLLIGVSPEGSTAELTIEPPGGGAGGHRIQSAQINGRPVAVADPLVTAPARLSGSITLTDRWAAGTSLLAYGICVRLMDVPSRSVRARINLGGARRVCLRLTERFLTVSDDRGRLLAVDLERGLLLRNSRIRC
jgi:hypothetical protein